MYACSDVAFLLLTHKSANLLHRNLYGSRPQPIHHETNWYPTDLFRFGETVLNYAIRSYKKDIVEKLLELGMDPRLPDDRKNRTALQVAASLGPPGKEIYALLKGKFNCFHRCSYVS